MEVVGELGHDLFAGWELVHADQLISLGVDALAVDAVGPSPLVLPIVLTTPAVLIDITKGEAGDTVFVAGKAPFIEDGEPVLQGDIRKSILVVSNGLL